MSGKLRLGVIGAGLKAAEYATSWAKMPEIEFAALADTTAASRQRLIDVCLAAGAPEPKGFEDYREMLAEMKSKLDIVYVSPPMPSMQSR
ncbi:GFO/IDH/MocA family oxidoreductase, partial [Rhizobium sp. Pop5]